MRGIDSNFDMLCPRYNEPLTPTARIAARLWEIFTFNNPKMHVDIILQPGCCSNLIRLLLTEVYTACYSLRMCLTSCSSLRMFLTNCSSLRIFLTSCSSPRMCLTSCSSLRMFLTNCSSPKDIFDQLQFA